jgi:hypothetical protein
MRTRITPLRSSARKGATEASVIAERAGVAFTVLPELALRRLGELTAGAQLSTSVI